MSELTPTPEELIEEVTFTVDEAQVVPMPIDPTLSHEGEAADAAAVGNAIAGVFVGATVNGKNIVNKAVTVYSADIKMSDAEGAQSIAEAFESIQDKDASEIMYDTENLVTVKDALDGIAEDLESEISTEEIDAILDEVFGGE